MSAKERNLLRREQRNYDALKELTEIKHDLELQCKPIDQNLKSWINAIEFCLSDYPRVLGNPN